MSDPGAAGLTVSFRPTAPALVGGPLEVVESLANSGDRAASVPVGADRMRRRPAFLTVSATTEPPGPALVDPWAALPDRGGIAGQAEVAPGDELERVVLVNDFLTLESLLEVVEEGASLRLRLRLVRALGETASAAYDLDVTLTQDPAGLARLCETWAAELRADPPASVADRERAISHLAAIALPAAADALTQLSASPDPHLAGLAADALGRRARR